jgi:hypothetical protein
MPDPRARVAVETIPEYFSAAEELTLLLRLLDEYGNDVGPIATLLEGRN